MQCIFDVAVTLDSEYEKMMAEYLQAAHVQEVVDILLELDNTSSRHYSIAISLHDVLCWDGTRGAWLGTFLVHEPSRALPLFEEAIRAVQRSVMAAHEDGHFMSVKPSVHARLYRLPHCTELRKLNVSSLRADDSNCLIQVPGTVIRTGQLKMLQLSREYECAKCKFRHTVRAELEERHQMSLPAECTASGGTGKPCGGTKFELVDGSEECHDYQEVRIQEQVHRLLVGSIPRSITLLLQDDLIDACKPGDDITVVGTLRKRWRPLSRGNRPDAELAVDALHVHVHNDEVGSARVSRELGAEFEAWWRARREAGMPLKARDEIVAMACPSLAGMYLVKLGLLLTLIGGVSHTDASSMRVRGESHLLLVGDAGTGKSALLRHAARLSPRSVLTTGIGATSAGLTCTAIREPGGEWMLEAGALVLADGGVCAIDEFDSIREHDRGAIHEAMEQQTLSVAKAGLVCKLRTKCSVFAACNPKGKGYDHERLISVNTGLPSPLLSRFDVVLLLLDKSRAGGGRSEEHDRDVAQHILREACGEEGPPPEPDAAEWPLEKMRAYVEFVRGSFRPSVTPPAQRAIVAYYSHQRQADTTSEARTTIRLLESAVRLAQAHARLMFREEVTLLDAIYVIVVLESSTLHSRLAGGSICALTSMFDETPDATYPLLRDKILDSLGIDAEGRPLRQEGGGGYPGERLGGHMYM